MFHPRRIKPTSWITRSGGSSKSRRQSFYLSRIPETIVPSSHHSHEISKRRIFSTSYKCMDCNFHILRPCNNGMTTYSNFLNDTRSYPTITATKSTKSTTTTSIATKSFASMPLGEERVKARNEHLKEEIFRKATIKSTKQQLQDEEAEESRNAREDSNECRDSIQPLKTKHIRNPMPLEKNCWIWQ